MARTALAILLLSLLSACEDPRVRDTKGRMVGTWIADSVAHGGVSRRVLTLQADGRVKETIRLVAPSGASDSESREGEWFFDGVNFKRKYTHVDGKALTNAHFIYETHELRSVTASEFVAASRVGKGEVRFQREGTGAPR